MYQPNVCIYIHVAIIKLEQKYRVHGPTVAFQQLNTLSMTERNILSIFYTGSDHIQSLFTTNFIKLLI